MRQTPMTTKFNVGDEVKVISGMWQGTLGKVNYIYPKMKTIEVYFTKLPDLRVGGKVTFLASQLELTPTQAFNNSFEDHLNDN